MRLAVKTLSMILLMFAIVQADAAPKKSAHKKPVKTAATKTVTKTVTSEDGKTKQKIIYAENQTVDFEGLSLEGELKTPGEFYFQNRNQERFDSLTKRRLNFHREMLRDSIQSQ